jgi:hypothetical protein
MDGEAKMKNNELRVANDHQLKIFFNSYDQYWRLTKLISIKFALERRDELPKYFEAYYGSNFRDFTQLTYKNFTNGILSSALSECIMLAEDYFSLLKYIRDPYHFVRHMVNYSAGGVTDFGLRLGDVSDDKFRKLYMIPWSKNEFQKSNLSLSKESLNQAFEYFEKGIVRIRKNNDEIVKFYKTHSKYHGQYKHGLKLCLNGFGSDISADEIETRKKSLGGSLWGFDSVLKGKKVADTGGILIPDFSKPEIMMNTKRLIEDNNFLHITFKEEINIEDLIRFSKTVLENVNCLRDNRISIIDEPENIIRLHFPDTEQEKIDSITLTFTLGEGTSRPTIEEYQVKL